MNVLKLTHRVGFPRKAVIHRAFTAHGAVFAALAAATSVASISSGVYAAGTALADSTSVHYRSLPVQGIKIFYREAGDPGKPTLLLLHGFPSSSNEFRNLIPLLSSRFHIVAPDYPGFGLSDAPAATAFKPTFANLATVMDGFVQAAGLRKFTIYMQDFGGPVGFRLATAHPENVEGFIIQNANAYEVGIAPEVLKEMRARAQGPLDTKASKGLEQMLSFEGTKFQYLTGVRDASRIDPTSYSVDSWIQAMPEQHRIQKALIVDYYDNVRQYPQWQAYLKQYQPETLILWGKNDPIFIVAGATAYKEDLPNAELHLLDSGHFALEDEGDVVAQQIIKTFAR